MENRFDDLTKREPSVTRLLQEARKTAAEARELSISGERLTQSLNETNKGINTTIASLDAFVSKQQKASPPAANAEPFRIEPYARAAAELNQTVAGVNQALTSSQKFVEARPWQAALADADALARARIDQVFWRSAALMALFFALLLGYRVVAARLLRTRVAT